MRWQIFDERQHSNIDLDWQRGDFGAALGVRKGSALDAGCSAVVNTAVGIDQPELAALCSDPDVVDPQFGGPHDVLDETWYFDLQGTWYAPWNGRITIGIRNLFDDDPPASFSTTFASFDPQYEVPGRFGYLQHAQRF